MAQTKYYSHIDGLRAISVALVVLFHYQIGPFFGGYLGVDIFFTISGFLIIGSIVDLQEQVSFSMTDFWQRRIRRLLPAILTTLTACIAAGFLLMTPDDFAFLAQQSLLSLFSAINFSLLGETDYFALKQSTDPLLHLWSLAVEEQFYIVFPLLASLVYAKFADTKTVRTRLIGILVFLSIVSVIASQWLISNGSQLAAYYMMPTRFSQLALGGVLALYLGSMAGRRNFEKLSTGFHTACVVLGLALVLYGALLFDHQTPFPGYRALLPTLGAMLILLSGAHSGLSQIFENPVSTYIGKLSFSLYLVHWPVWIFSIYYLDRQLSDFETLLALLATFALSAGMYHGIETPIRFSERFSGARMYRVVLPAFNLVLLSTIVVIATQGLPSRLEEDRQELAQGAKDFHRLHFGGTGYLGNSVHHLGNPDAEPDFIIIGDSKARQFAIGLNTALQASRRAALLATHDGCPFVVGVIKLQDGKPLHSCHDMTEKALALVTEHDLPVIYITSWGHHDYLRHHQNRKKQERQVAEHEITQLRTELTLEYIALLRAGLSPQTPIYLLGENTGFSSAQPIVNCLTKPTWLGLPCFKGNEFSPDSYEVPPVERLLAQNLPANVHFIPMVEIFCPGGSCRQVSANGEILFSDPYHLSEWGSRLMSPTLLDIISPLPLNNSSKL